MVKRSPGTKVFASVLCLLAINVTLPLSWAETAAFPMGAIVTRGTVTVGNSVAPTGTTVFAGDRVVANEPALINFSSGSRVEMTKAAATFSRQGKILLVRADEGFLRFNFLRGEEAEIDAGNYRFASFGNAAHVGELGVNRNGQLVLTVSEGGFDSLNTASGEHAGVLLGSPFMAMDVEGKGTLTKGGKTLTDTTKSFQTDELKGKCVVANGEAYPITANTATTITIKGSWKLDTGTYDYKVVDCTKEALVAAGATAGAAAGAKHKAGEKTKK